MKRRLLISLLVSLTLCAALAHAEEDLTTLDMRTFDFRQNLADHVVEDTPLTDEALYASVSGDLVVRDLIPLADGGLLFLGSYIYREMLVDEMFNVGHEDTPKRSDAYAIAIDRDGKRMWTLRLQDPQAGGNTFEGERMPDGRFFLQYSGDGTLGTQYFIVSEAGLIDEALPAKRLRELKAWHSLQWTPGGYFSGGFEVDQFSLRMPLVNSSRLVFLDEGLNTVWTFQDKTLTGGYLQLAKRGEGAPFLLYGSIFNFNGMDRPIACMISPDGQPLWRFDGHRYAVYGISDALPTEDGGAVLVSMYDPNVATPVEPPDKAALTRVDGKGEKVWSRAYGASHGLNSFRFIRPLGDGYLLGGVLDGEVQTPVLLYVDADGEPIGTVRLPYDQTRDNFVRFYAEATPDGVWVYGNHIVIVQEDENVWNEEYRELFYALVTEETFKE